MNHHPNAHKAWGIGGRMCTYPYGCYWSLKTREHGTLQVKCKPRIVNGAGHFGQKTFMKNSKRITTYANGVSIKVPNKSITLLNPKEGVFHIICRIVDKDLDKPSCKHTLLRNKVRQTEMAISEEGMKILVGAFIKIQQSKIEND